MSGATTELNLSTAVDSDDNADYLTIALANSLRTLDALFNNTTGHTHNGAHQGGPIGVIPIGAIPDGSITSVKIADGTIQGVDIGTAQISMAKLAANAATRLNIANGSSDFATSSTSYVDVPGLAMTVTFLGNGCLFLVSWAMTLTSGGAAYFTMSVDGADGSQYGLTNVVGTSMQVFAAFIAPSAASHTVKARVKTNGQSVSIPSASGAVSSMLIAEFMR